MATPESKASQEVKLRAADWKVKLHRNNSGVLLNPKTGIPVRFGMGNISKEHNAQVKSSDEIGWTPVRITQQMVGKHIAVFTAIEIKTPSFKIKSEYRKGSREAAQLKFINIVKYAGGIAGIARNAEDVDTIMKGYITWLTNRST
jgi:hypothetical protein